MEGYFNSHPYLSNFTFRFSVLSFSFITDDEILYELLNFIKCCLALRPNRLAIKREMNGA